jgi:hypothetical protein
MVSQASQSQRIDLILEASLMGNTEEEVGSNLEELTMADGVSPATPRRQRLRRSQKRGSTTDPDVQAPRYMLSMAQRMERSSMSPVPTKRPASPHRPSHLWDAEMMNRNHRAGGTPIQEITLLDIAPEEFGFTEPDWTNQASFSAIPEVRSSQGSGSVDYSSISGLGDDIKSVGNPWDDFEDETVIPSYVPLEDASVVLSPIPRPTHALSTMISSRDLNTAPSEHRSPKSPLISKLPSPKSVRMSPLAKDIASPKEKGKLDAILFPETPKACTRSPIKKKIIRLSSKVSKPSVV